MVIYKTTNACDPTSNRFQTKGRSMTVPTRTYLSYSKIDSSILQPSVLMKFVRFGSRFDTDTETMNKTLTFCKESNCFPPTARDMSSVQIPTKTTLFSIVM